jgi:hypothetical protein
MIAITGCFLCLLLIMLLIPESQLGRALQSLLVERPLASLARFERHHLIYAVIIGGMAMGSAELIFLAGPELVTMWALNLSIYFDAVIVTYALSALAAARGLKGWAGRAVRRLVRTMPRPRARRRRSINRPEKASNDDDGRPHCRIAA